MNDWHTKWTREDFTINVYRRESDNKVTLVEWKKAGTNINYCPTGPAEIVYDPDTGHVTKTKDFDENGNLLKVKDFNAQTRELEEESRPAPAYFFCPKKGGVKKEFQRFVDPVTYNLTPDYVFPAPESKSEPEPYHPSI